MKYMTDSQAVTILGAGIASFYFLFARREKFFSPKEKELLKRLKIDMRVARALKKNARQPLFAVKGYEGSDEEVRAMTASTPDVGIASFCPPTLSRKDRYIRLFELRKKIERFGCIAVLSNVFLSGKNTDTFEIYKTRTMADVVQWKRPGTGFDSENEDINTVEKIVEWSQQFGLTILDVGNEHLDAMLGRQPTKEEAQKIAADVSSMCDDLEGVEKIEMSEWYEDAYTRALTNRTISLWWD